MKERMIIESLCASWGWWVALTCVAILIFKGMAAHFRNSTED